VFATAVLPERETWVVEDDGAVVALMVLEPGWIDQLYVDPTYTGSFWVRAWSILPTSSTPTASTCGLSRRIALAVPAIIRAVAGPA
jgi:hypothetical protein